MKPEYRPDVDGLRAVAVLLVIGFHAFPGNVGGGFVGVDVFFVISGFLISSIIYKGLAAGEFSFLDFYARRIKRIFPALIVVLAAVVILGWFVLFPTNYRLLGKHIGAAAASIANFAYLQESSYFNVEPDANPLLHLWSLGIEEQFYIVWPFLIALAWRWRNAPAAIALIIFTISFVWCVALTASNPTAAFFLPFTRFWELMLGCLLALGPMRTNGAAAVPWPSFRGLYQRHRLLVHEAAAALGIALIIASVVLINRQSAFPGAWALLPTAATALLIFSGPATSINRLLSHRSLVYVGLISYPLYLWHWPLLVFLHVIDVREPTALMKVGAIAVAFILAGGTYRYIERPIRFGAPRPLKPVATAIAVVLIGCVGLLVYGSDGIPSRFSAAAQRTVRDLRTEALEGSRIGRCLIDIHQDFKDFGRECDPADLTNARTVVLWGDSHAAQLFPGLKDLADRQRTFAVAQYTMAACPPVLSIESAYAKNCSSINQLVIRKIAALKPETVIMAAHWSLYDGAQQFGQVETGVLRATVDRLHDLKVKRVIAVGQFPIWRAPPPKIYAWLLRSHSPWFFSQAGAPVPERDRSFLDPSTFDKHERSRQLLTSAHANFVSPLSILCREEDGCLLVVPGGQGEPIAWDYGHLTKAGSIYFAGLSARALVGD